MSFKLKVANKFKEGSLKNVTFSQICQAVNAVTEGERRLLRSAIFQLQKENLISFDGKVFRLSAVEQYKNPNELKKAKTVVGTFKAHEHGFGFLITDEKDYFVSRGNMGRALNGDRCECVIIDSKKGKNDSAVVLKVLEHTITRLVGTYFTEGAYSYLRPDDKHYLSDIFIEDFNGLMPQTGDKIFVEITSFPKRGCPHGKIEAILGRQFELAAEETAFLYLYGFVNEFPNKVISEVQSIPKDVEDEKLVGRLNLTDQLIFTIDGDNAKDFDDAVSLEILEDGTYLLGVHIADVSEYVKPFSNVDKEAFKRGTSAYFPDKVIPMLPFELSNGICSLSQDNIRLTISVYIYIDKTGEIIDRKFYESYIKSTYRLTYDKVQRILEGDSNLQQQYEKVVPTLQEMLKLKNILQERRLDDGYIDLAVTDSDVFYDGKNISVELHKKTDATEIIEQFMITANEVVAEYLYYLSLPCIYRVHDRPDKQKTEAFKDFLWALGLDIKWKKGELYPKDYQKILFNLKDSKKFAVVNRAMLRSMKKAVYSTENTGHFGLNSKCYCHFTSPIRRYPDLMVHRVLKASLQGDLSAIIDLYQDFMFDAAKNSTERERMADEAERAIDDLYKAKYMENFIDQTFTGTISGVLARGLYVELENTCEGFIPIELLPGSYEFYETSHTLVGKKAIYKLGDSIDIVVVGVDIGNRISQFMPAFYLADLQKLKKRGII